MKPKALSLFSLFQGEIQTFLQALANFKNQNIPSVITFRSFKQIASKPSKPNEAIQADSGRNSFWRLNFKKKKKKKTFHSGRALSYTKLVHRRATQTEGNKISNEHNRLKNPNWREADQLAIYKHDRRFELGSTKKQLQLSGQSGT